MYRRIFEMHSISTSQLACFQGNPGQAITYTSMKKLESLVKRNIQLQQRLYCALEYFS